MPMGNVAQPLPAEQTPPGITPVAPVNVAKPPPSSQAPPVGSHIEKY